MNNTDDLRHEEQTHLFLGLDLGKSQDFSALAALEYRRTWTMVRNRVNYGMDPKDELVEYSVRQLARIPLGTKYLDVVNTVQGLLRRVTKKYDCTLVVDATGVGAPVMEMFQEMIPPQRAVMVPVVITSGESVSGNGRRGQNDWRVSRQDLLTGLQVMLETRQLAIGADLKFAPALREELLEMRSLRSDGSGRHDDLTMALALACWRARKVQPAPLLAAGAKPAGKPFGFQNNGFGESIYGSGSSPWGWPQQRPKPRVEEDDRDE